MRVDIAAVSRGEDEGAEVHVLPVWTPYVVDSETAEGGFLDFPTRVENTVDVRGNVEVEGSVSVDNEVEVWVNNF